MIQSKLKVLLQKQTEYGTITATQYQCGTIVVHRHNGSVGAHCGEKHPSQDWREVKLIGIPHEVRLEIIKLSN